MWYEGIVAPSAWETVAIALVFTHVTIAGVTIYLHRYSAHRALELHSAVKFFFRTWMWMSTGMLTKAWTAVHRKHHARVETEEDPHSPQVKGIKLVMSRGAELYRSAACDPETLAKYGKGTPDDWFEHNLFCHDRWGIYLMLSINLVLFGALGLTIWAIQMMWIPVLAAGVINGVGHYWGYRSFECDDASTNIVPWGILVGGEELHNNHHTYPSSAKLSVKWWEFDIGWLYIRILSMLGLASVKRVPPVAHQDGTKLDIDLDTLSAVINNRFQIMAQYARTVVTPLVAAERNALGDQNLYRRAKALLCKSEAIMDESSRKGLAQLRAKSQVLEIVYVKRLELQELWENRQATSEELREALLEWCGKAEESGIESLREFALRLRTYTMAPASA
jgi:stearoyl-CoA desaturase (Delta-9 desaturase)